MQNCNPWSIFSMPKKILWIANVIDSVSYTSREGNKVADALSNEVCVIGSSLIYMQESNLPKVAREKIRVDRLGFPYVRTCKH